MEGDEKTICTNLVQELKDPRHTISALGGIEIEA
jgi:hypothetical protein